MRKNPPKTISHEEYDFNLFTKSPSRIIVVHGCSPVHLNSKHRSFRSADPQLKEYFSYDTKIFLEGLLLANLIFVAMALVRLVWKILAVWLFSHTIFKKKSEEIVFKLKNNRAQLERNIDVKAKYIWVINKL